MNFQRFFSALTLAILTFAASAQSPVSGFLQGKGNGSICVSYTSETYDNVLLAPSIEAQGVPVFNEVAVKSTSIYAVYGLSDRLDAVVSLPYIAAKGAASPAVLSELGYENERKGIQDISAFLKFKAYGAKFSGCSLDFLLAAGLRSPLGRYRVDEGLQSIIAIGNRATSGTGLAIAQFRTSSGLFITTQAGYSLRSGDVPNALLGEVKAGYASSRFYADVWLAGQTSDGGVNILGEGFAGNFPATDVSFHRAGVNVYVPIAGGFGIAGGASKYLNGRNVGQSTGFSGSLIFNF